MAAVRVFFFFQAEDGIRDYRVTGVQTCALPISLVGSTFRDGCHGRANQGWPRSEEHTSELQSHDNLVCRLLLEKKKTSHAAHAPRRASQPPGWCRGARLPL